MIRSQTISIETTEKSSTRGETKPVSSSRLVFIDNLRVVLTMLVMLHHLAITYGAPGDWYYNEAPILDMPTSLLFTLFVATNQAFFMGFFFLIAGYFTPGPYDRKGVRLFLQDRLLRLGVPLLVYVFIMNPLLNYFLAINQQDSTESLGVFLWRYFTEADGLRTGPLWFVETLLIFAGFYALWRWLAKPGAAQAQGQNTLPGNGVIAVFALALGLVSFGVRIWLPTGWNFELLDLQLPYFPQYIAMFMVGIMAYRRNWLVNLPQATARLWLGLAVGLVILAPLIFGLAGALEGDQTPFRGGLHWQALVTAVWEQFVGVAMMIGLIGLFREKFNGQGSLAKILAASAYTAYIIHAPMVVLVSLALREINLYPLLKFGVAATLAVPLSFWLSHYLRKLLLARHIL